MRKTYPARHRAAPDRSLAALDRAIGLLGRCQRLTESFDGLYSKCSTERDRLRAENDSLRALASQPAPMERTVSIDEMKQTLKRRAVNKWKDIRPISSKRNLAECYTITRRRGQLELFFWFNVAGGSTRVETIVLPENAGYAETLSI